MGIFNDFVEQQDGIQKKKRHAPAIPQQSKLFIYLYLHVEGNSRPIPQDGYFYFFNLDTNK
jgi:hypothetical protein